MVVPILGCAELWKCRCARCCCSSTVISKWLGSCEPGEPDVFNTVALAYPEWWVDSALCNRLVAMSKEELSRLSSEVFELEHHVFDELTASNLTQYGPEQAELPEQYVCRDQPDLSVADVFERYLAELPLEWRLDGVYMLESLVFEVEERSTFRGKLARFFGRARDLEPRPASEQ